MVLLCCRGCFLGRRRYVSRISSAKDIVQLFHHIVSVRDGTALLVAHRNQAWAAWQNAATFEHKNNVCKDTIDDFLPWRTVGGSSVSEAAQ